MPLRINQKWRPSLGLVLGGTLSAVLTLPLAGLAAMPRLASVLGSGFAFGLIVLIVALVTGVLAWLLRRLILRPLTDLTNRAEAVSAGGAAATHPLEHYGTAEVGHLGQAVLGMAEALRSREAAIRSYADHVTHELRTPLAAIRGSAELLEDESGLSLEARARLDAIRAAERRMEHLLDAARQIAKARAPIPTGKTCLDDLVRALQAGQPGLSLSVSGGAATLPVSASGLTLILGHLLRNAAEAGADHVRLEAGTDGSVDVSDNGPGIAPGNRSRVFDPFFTTRRDDGGTGMGLAIVDAMMSSMGGDIRLEPSEVGSRFHLTF